MTRNILLVAALVGCGGPTGDTHGGIQVGSEGSFGCSVDTVTEVADADATIEALSMTANEATAGLFGTFTGSGETWDSTPVDGITVVVGAPASLWWVTTAGPGGAAQDCQPYLAAAVETDVDAGDVFAASGMAGWVDVSAQITLLRVSLPIEDTSGSLEPRWADPDTLDQVDAQLLAERSGGEWHGALGFQGCNDGGECSPPVTLEDAELTLVVAP